MKKNELDRRAFIKAGSLLTVGSLVIPGRLLGMNTPDAIGGCDPTTDDIQGPFYLPGSPNTTMIAGPNEPGTRLFISGTVYSSDCQTPLPGAMIEVWQANDAADYDTSSNFELRGTMFSDANGQYAYETIKPGHYLNGNQFRPSHIHYRVSGPGFPTLVTQLYFQGDPYISIDPWASDPAAALRIIPLNSVNGSDLEGVFDIVLDGTTSIKPNRFGEDGDLLAPYPNPSADATNLHFNVFRSSDIQVIITDMRGKEIVTLISRKSPQGRYSTRWNGLDAKGGQVCQGMYLATLVVDGRIIKSQRIVRK